MCCLKNLHKQDFPIRLYSLTRHAVLLWSCRVLVYVLANLIKERRLYQLKRF